ncbi:MAG: twin-arginine translocation signal domain-containing protein, partial [Opitutales bacterium]|nr:twin-arginine translocation signal domain-containing protein [Opitutales bacterium]
MKAYSRRNFLRKLAAGPAAAAMLANSAFALKRRPVDTMETMRRARGNVAAGAQICDAFGLPKSAGMFDCGIVGDALFEAKSAEEIRAKNSELASFCQNLKTAKFCAEIPLDSGSQKYLDELLANPKCAAVSVRVAKGEDAAGAEFLNLLEKSARGGRPVYIFAKPGGGKFAREIADMEIAKAVLLLLEGGAFEKFAGLKIVLPNA